MLQFDPANELFLQQTILELIGVAHEHPDWVADGMSLVPLINQLASSPR